MSLGRRLPVWGLALGVVGILALSLVGLAVVGGDTLPERNGPPIEELAVEKTELKPGDRPLDQEHGTGRGDRLSDSGQRFLRGLHRQRDLRSAGRGNAHRHVPLADRLAAGDRTDDLNRDSHPAPDSRRCRNARTKRGLPTIDDPHRDLRGCDPRDARSCSPSPSFAGADANGPPRSSRSQLDFSESSPSTGPWRRWT